MYLIASFILFLTVIFAPTPHLVVFEDGSIAVERGDTLLGGACVRPEWGCTQDGGDDSYEFFEDGSVILTVGTVTVSDCAYPDMGCSE